MAKVLKGSTRAELSIERPTKFEFVVNVKTAQAMELAIPPSILLQATEKLSDTDPA